MKKIIKYEAEDGCVFNTEAECKAYEELQKRTYDVTFEVDAILRLDRVKLVLPVEYSKFLNDMVDEKGINHCACGQDFYDRAWNTINDCESYPNVEELLSIARRQGIYPYVDCFVDTDMIKIVRQQKRR